MFDESLENIKSLLEKLECIEPHQLSGLLQLIEASEVDENNGAFPN